MGSYLNPGNFSFRGSLRSKIYIDKSDLITKTNEALCKETKPYTNVLSFFRNRNSYWKNNCDPCSTP